LFKTGALFLGEGGPYHPANLVRGGFFVEAEQRLQVLATEAGEATVEPAVRSKAEATTPGAERL
jgi:hypothetical protein